MLNNAALSELTREIQAQGYDEPTASRYAVLIGDLPCINDNGNVLVLDESKATVLATLKPLRIFQTERQG